MGGKVYPTIDEVAHAIANRDRARILPTGSYALNTISLSSQVPTKVVYLTDGTPRIIKVRKQTILFKLTTSRNLSVKVNLSGLAIQALKSIGKDNLINPEIEKIVKILQNESASNLTHDKDLAQVWFAKIFDIAKKKLQKFYRAFKLKNKDREDVFNQIFSKKNLSPMGIEKVWWIICRRLIKIGRFGLFFLTFWFY